MPKTPDTRRHWRLLASWPARDRALWRLGTAACDDLDIPTYGQSLTQPSLDTTERAYGRYLNFLDGSGSLDADADPRSRVTPALIADYLRHLQELGYSRQTVILAISGLRCALRILAPETDTRWLWRPNGISLSSRIMGARKTFDVPHSAELFRWGLSLMSKSEHLGPRRRAATMRDGLMISLLAARPLRRRTFAGLRLGQHLVRREAGWRLHLGAEDMKNRRAIEFDVPVSLDPYVDHYMAVARTRLLRGAVSDAVWIAAYGHPLTMTAVGLMIGRRAKQEFGIEFGPHRFRHALDTAAPIADPANPGAAAVVLAIGSRTVAEHYDRSGNHVAAHDLHDVLATERAKLEPLARRSFERPSNQQRET